MKYKRDKRSPIPSSSLASKKMSSIKGKNTKPEIFLRNLLWHNGLKGYRLQYKKVPGRPDIAFVKSKVAIFVHGCYWHRCPKCQPNLPKSNTEFWRDKFERNITRDKIKEKELIDLGWKVVTVWECEIKLYSENVLKKIKTKTSS